MYRTTIVLCSIAADYVAVGSAESAPITLAFEAEVSRLPIGIPFDSGIGVALGDRITGTLTFTPNPGTGTPNTSAPGNSLVETQLDASAVFQIDGQTFANLPGGGNGIRFTARDNVPFIDFDSAPIQDQLSIGGGFTVVPDEGVISLDNSGWSLTMAAPATTVLTIDPDGGVTGFDSSPLPTAMIPADIETWNFFTQFSSPGLGAVLGVTLRDGQGGVVGFDARISRFLVVPEPCATTLSCLALAVCHWLRQ